MKTFIIIIKMRGCEVKEYIRGESLGDVIDYAIQLNQDRLYSVSSEKILWFNSDFIFN